MISNTENGRVNWDKVIIAMGELTTVILNPVDGPQILVATPLYNYLGGGGLPSVNPCGGGVCGIA